MPSYFIISTSTHDMVLEFGNLRIPIKTLSSSCERNYESGISSQYILDVKTYPVESKILERVLENIERAKLSVYAKDIDSDNEVVIEEYSLFYSGNYKIISTSKESFDFRLVARLRKPS